MKAELSSITPLTEASFYILISLIEPLHGYGIMQKVENLSGGRVRLGPGTLYGALNNLQKLGLIIQLSVESGSSRRKSTVLTDNGSEIIHMEIARMEEMVGNAKQLLAMRGEGNE